MGIPDLSPEKPVCGSRSKLEPDMKQWTGSKLGKEYVKTVYCYPAFLTYPLQYSCLDTSENADPMSGADGERTGALPAGAGSQAAPSEVGSMGGAGLPSLPFSAAVKSCLFPSCQLREDLASQVASVWKVLIFLPLNSLNHHPTSLARWRRCLIWPHLCPLAGTPRPQSPVS